MNLGQSQYQDRIFVSGAQQTPYRRLRQIELELRSIDDSLVRADFSIRRTKLKLEKLNKEDPSELIDYEEACWELNQQKQLLDDATARKLNFEALKKETLESASEEYWNKGFEAAEEEHWVLYLTKQLTMSKALGMPDRNSMDMLLLMPPESQQKIMLGVHSSILQLQQNEQKVAALLGN